MQSKWRRFQQTILLILLFSMACKGGVIPSLKITKDFAKQTTLCADVGQIKETLLLIGEPDVSIAGCLEEIKTHRLTGLERCHPM